MALLIFFTPVPATAPKPQSKVEPMRPPTTALPPPRPSCAADHTSTGVIREEQRGPGKLPFRGLVCTPRSEWVRMKLPQV